jgi:type IV pilus assembly protein PilX
MMKLFSNSKAQRRQRGAALVVALIMLLVMTVLGITAMQVTRMEERMAGNSRDINLAFQASEAGLRDAEARIRTLLWPVTFCTAAPCAGRVWDRGTWMTDHRDDPIAWWTTNGTEYGVAGTREIIEVTRDPIIVTEHLMFVPDSLSIGDEEAEDGRDFYRVTSNSTGASDTATVVLESTFTRRRY